jgi:hypothetical protein
MMLNNFLIQLRENARLRWGVALIIGTCWLYCILLIHEALQTGTRLHRSASQSLVRTRAQMTQTEWLARVAPAKTLAVQLESRLWRAATPGLAQAAFQDTLKAATLKAAVARPQVNVTLVEEPPAEAPNPTSNASAPSTPPDLWKVKAMVSFEFSAPGVLDVLRQIEGHDRQIVVAALSFSQSPLSRVELELYAYFQKPAGVTVPATAAEPS